MPGKAETIPRDLIGKTSHCSKTKHIQHLGAEHEADAADTEQRHKGDSNRQPGNRIRQLFVGHRERPGNGRRDGDTQVNQVGRRAAGDLRLHLADAQSQPDQRRGSNHRQNAEANGDGETTDQVSIADSQAKSQAEEGPSTATITTAVLLEISPRLAITTDLIKRMKKPSDGLDEAIRAS